MLMDVKSNLEMEPHAEELVDLSIWMTCSAILLSINFRIAFTLKTELLVTSFLE